MDISIVMLGTGSAFAKSYYNTNALVSCNGYTLMVDCGYTGPRSLFDLHIDPPELGAIFVTHVHADHVGGLEEIAFRSKYVYDHKPTLIVPEDLIQPLWDYSLRGGLENASEGMDRLDSYFHVIPVRADVPAEIHPGFKLEAVRTRHVPGKPSYGLLFNDYVYYSSDSQFDRPLLERMLLERNVQYVLHDCQLYPPGAVHATLSELLTLPDQLQRSIRLMHYGDDKDSFVGRTGAMTFIEQHKRYDFPRTS